VVQETASLREPHSLTDPLLEEVRRFYDAHHEGIEASRRRHQYYYETTTRASSRSATERLARFPASNPIVGELARGRGYVLGVACERSHEGAPHTMASCPWATCFIIESCVSNGKAHRVHGNSEA
jgi:hypothetical protein